MKKLNPKWQLLAIRLMVALAGITCTLVVMLFMDSLWALCITAFVGAYILVLLDEHLKELYAKTHDYGK